MWRPLAAAAGKGPLLIVLDDGWAAAPSWDKRVALAREAARRRPRRAARSRCSRCRRAARRSRRPTAAPWRAGSPPPSPRPMRRRARRPPPPPRASSPLHPDAETLWIADGLDLGGGDAFAAALAGHSVQVAADPAANRALVGAESLPGALDLSVARVGPEAPARGVVRAFDARGRNVGEAPFDFGDKTDGQGAVRPAGRTAQRHRPARRRRRALGRRGLAGRRARQAPARRRHRRRQRRSRAAAARADLLHHPGARALRRRARGQGRRRRSDRRPARRAALGAGPRRHERRRRPRSRQDRRLRRGRRRADPLRRHAPGRRGRRPDPEPRCGAAAARSAARCPGRRRSASRRSSRRARSSACTAPAEVTVSRQVLAEPDAGPAGKDLGAARRRHAAA